MKINFILFFLITSSCSCEKDNWSYLNWISTRDFHKFRFIHAHHIQRYRNVQVDPCIDFYEYSCGNWKNFHPDDYVTSLQRKRVQFLLKQLVKSDSSVNDSYILRKIKHFYKSCIDETSIALDLSQSIVYFLKGFASWPVYYRNWRSLNFDWLNIIAQCRKFGLKIFIDEFISTKDSTPDGLYEIYITCPQRSKPANLPLRNDLHKLKVRPRYVGRMLHLVDRFQTSLMKINCIDRANTTKLSLEALSRVIPQIDWKSYLSIVQKRVVNEKTILNVAGLTYFRRLIKLLRETNWNIIADYIFIRIVNYLKGIVNVESMKVDRGKFCFRKIHDYMNDGLNFEFIRRYSRKDNDVDIVTMFENIRKSFGNKLSTLPHMDTFFKKSFLKKLRRIVLLVGGIPLLDEYHLNKTISMIPITSDSFLKNLIFLLWNKEETTQKKVGFTKEYTINSYEVNAYHSNTLSKGSIFLSTGIMQPPFYHPYAPQILNYAGIGHVIGHELMHAFDPLGIQFDFYGKKRKWLRKHHYNLINKRFDCYMRQCNNYDGKANGLTKLNENVADSEGLSIAYAVYKDWLSVNHKLVQKEMRSYSTLNLTSSQLFFVIYAQGKCSSFDGYKQMVQKTHGNPKYRVNAAVSNSVDFTTIFQCPSYSPMNPKIKCNYLT